MFLIPFSVLSPHQHSTQCTEPSPTTTPIGSPPSVAVPYPHQSYIHLHNTIFPSRPFFLSWSTLKVKALQFVEMSADVCPTTALHPRWLTASSNGSEKHSQYIMTNSTLIYWHRVLRPFALVRNLWWLSLWSALVNRTSVCLCLVWLSQRTGIASLDCVNR